jgi:Cdc6-like AAA superfamily ATPase
MIEHLETLTEEKGELEAREIFERQIGATGVPTKRSVAGNRPVLKFVVGREAPIYQHALRETKRSISEENPFRGTLGLLVQKVDRFPESLEATALLTLLTRSTRAVVEGETERGFSVPDVPFQNQEDHKLAQAATHVVVGRRGVGKSTLIRRAVGILRETAATVAVVDVQAHSMLTGVDLQRQILQDIISALVEDAKRVSAKFNLKIEPQKLLSISDDLAAGKTPVSAAIPNIKRELQTITGITKRGAFVFLDDFHLLEWNEQPKLLHLVHGALKGANGWLKVTGLRSLLNYYSAATREGLQVPGDAQIISLDVTLENPEAAESHLRAILGSFLRAVGYSVSAAVLPEQAFRRLAWASAGVPRDFLQMFARAVEHARRNKRAVVTLSDVNVAIGEFGQGKMDELSKDARNSEGELRDMISALEMYCLDDKQINAFLVASEESNERRLVQILSDLRLVHLINQSITPDRPGKRYAAYILDYSLFTGFRRRQNIEEMVPQEGQFKAQELRRLPKVNPGFLEKYRTTEK